MKVLITGVCGFVGSVLAQHWLESRPGLVVYGLDNFVRTGSEQNRMRLQKSGIRFFHGDVRLASDFENLPPVDWVVDCAANPSVIAGVDGSMGSRQLVEHNLQGTINILEYCKRVGAGFVLLSTSRVYSLAPLAAVPVEAAGQRFRLQDGAQFPPGLSQRGVSEAFSCAPPLSLYGSTKLASEVLALEYGATFDFPVWINRCGVLAGAGQFGRADQGIFSYWINAWAHRHPLAYLGFGGRGYQVRDCLHPRDLLSLLTQQTETAASSAPRVINVGGGENHSMSLAELSHWCQKRFGPHTIGSNTELRRFDVPWLVMDTTKARDVWNWRPQTSLETILEEIAMHAEQNPQWLELSGLM